MHQLSTLNRRHLAWQTSALLCLLWALAWPVPAQAAQAAQAEPVPAWLKDPAPAVDARTYAPETLDDLPPGADGELWVRGPQVMKGYWERADATAEVLTPDGYLRTGDMARLTNDGSIEIVDRKKDMILVSGFNVFPNEIEDIATRHEDVVEAACVGVPDDRTGEAVVLYVVMRNGATLDRDDLAAYLRSQLTAYKVPRRIEARAELPKTNVGKILRKDLRAEAVAGG